MRVFDASTEVIKAGGKRRGAMMGILRADHPDVIEFITSKQTLGILSNFNISVAVTDEFIEALEKDEEYWLVNPRNREKTGKLKAKDVWNLMAKSAWASGDPGVIFIDEINRHNPTPEVGMIKSTNPCGEQPLLPYESCNLGSINLTRMVENGKINWEKLRETVRNAVHFLDNIIDANNYPLKEIEAITRANRKIGLGVMGFADMLIKLGIPYNSEEALQLAENLMKFIEEEAHKKSVEIGEERGSFPNFEKSIWKDKYSAMRNATVTTIAPTGSISIIAGCSSGIEPIFAISFIRNVLGGTRLFETNPLFEIMAKERGFYSAELLERIAKTGSAQKIEAIPEDVKKIFVTALDIQPEWHVRMQAAFQKYTDNAVSKTVNLPNEARVADVRKVYELAWKLKCKGVTVFRYGSKPEQVLYIGEIKTKETKFVSAESEYAGGCPTKTCPFPS
jgi:ribonucleoside-diphosphate reductase alpha chain